MREDGRTTKGITKIMTRVLIIGVGAWILLGVFWACLQFPYFQEFGESYFLLKVQENLLCDEYVGIMYPMLIKAALWAAKSIPIPYTCYLYALQLAVAALSARYFLAAFPAIRKGGAALGWLGALAVLTIPQAMQCHMAVLPHSLAASIFLFQLGIALRGFYASDPIEAKERDGKEQEKSRGRGKWEMPSYRITIMGILWLLEILLAPEYRYFGGILLVFYAIWEIFRVRQAKTGFAGITAVVIVTAAMLGIVPQIWRFTMTEGCLGRMTDSPEAAAMRRYAWDDFGELYGYWPQELKDALTQEEIAVCNKYPEKKRWILGEKVDGVYGKEKAREIYKAVARAGKKVRFKRNLKEMMKDAIGYGLAPLAQPSLMEGTGVQGYAAANYEIMRTKHPRLTCFYVRYCGWFFGAALFVSLALLFMTFWMSKGKERMALLGKGIGFLCLGGLFVWYYVMRGGGMLDQKNALPVTALWVAFAFVMTSFWMSGAKE
ncbi:MAG: hypothetical protein IKS85_09545 [Lachnospiraceae bacterium]|nr:hypothetical protein [Lachnospiraceae bacterium]